MSNLEPLNVIMQFHFAVTNYSGDPSLEDHRRRALKGLQTSLTKSTGVDLSAYDSVLETAAPLPETETYPDAPGDEVIISHVFGRAVDVMALMAPNLPTLVAFASGRTATIFPAGLYEVLCALDDVDLVTISNHPVSLTRFVRVLRRQPWYTEFLSRQENGVVLNMGTIEYLRDDCPQPVKIFLNLAHDALAMKGQIGPNGPYTLAEDPPEGT